MADSSDVSPAEGFPVLDPKVEVQPSPDRPGHLRCFIPERAKQALINKSVYALMREFDGSRTCHEIADELIAEGIRLPNRDAVLAVAEQMSRSGLVTFVAERQEPTRPLRAVAELRFSCLGCGRSCQGHLVSVGDDEVDRIIEAHEALAEDYPHLQDIEPLVEMTDEDKGVTRTVLARREDESCAYLGDDNLCLIHGRFGAATKPMVCRLFPISIIETEHELRVGVGGSCFNVHRTAFSEPIRSLPEATGIGEPDLPAPVKRLIEEDDSAIAAEVVNFEESVLWILSQDDASLGKLFAFLYNALAGEDLPIEPDDILANTAVTGVLIDRLKQMADGLRGGEHMPRGGTGPGSFGHDVAALFDDIAELEPRPFTGLVGDERAYVFRVLREWVFLRQWRIHATPPLSVLIVLLGVLVAVWRAEDLDERDEDGPVADVFGYSLAAWIRTVQTGVRVTYLFGEPGAVTSEIDEFTHSVREACAG